MQPGRGSKTAEIVCMGRAIASEREPTPWFSDPTALTLLSDEARERVRQIRSSAKPRGARDAVARTFYLRQSLVTVARTIEIDDRVRAPVLPQVVILGAGLDGRAWRMPELSDSIVFEVDHPDTQRDKRARVGTLSKRARDVRFVPVDFERDDLEEALERAGHDRRHATTWIWEGVVMYLERPAIDATLEVVRARSARESRLVILYQRPGWVVRLARPVMRLLGEPWRTTFRPERMKDLLARFDFAVDRDVSVAEVGAARSRTLGKATVAGAHLRIVTATRR